MNTVLILAIAAIVFLVFGVLWISLVLMIVNTRAEGSMIASRLSIPGFICILLSLTIVVINGFLALAIYKGFVT